MASLVPGARFVELPGDDHLPFVGDQDALLDEIERFLTGRADARRIEPRTRHDPVRHPVRKAPRRADRSGDRSPAGARRRPDTAIQGARSAVERATVPFRRSPARPARSGAAAPSWTKPPTWAWRSASDCTPENGTRFRAVGEGPVAAAAARIAALAGPGDVLVSRTVVDLVAGSGFQFSDRGSHALAAGEEVWPLFAVR